MQLESQDVFSFVFLATVSEKNRSSVNEKR